jgi:hypothetical protein
MLVNVNVHLPVPPTRTPNLCKGIGFSYCRHSYGVHIREWERERERVRSRLFANLGKLLN